MASMNKTNKKLKVRVFDMINKAKLFTLSKRNPDHAHAIFTLVTLLHEAGYPVNWHTQHLRSFAFRNEHLPLYIRQAEIKNHIFADIVFALDEKTLVSLEVTTWRKEKLSKKTIEAFEQALREEKQKVGEHGEG